METGQRTFLPIDAWPKPRGTPDLDIFLPTEIVVDLTNMVRLREVLDKLDYKPRDVMHRILRDARRDASGPRQ